MNWIYWWVGTGLGVGIGMLVAQATDNVFLVVLAASAASTCVKKVVQSKGGGA